MRLLVYVRTLISILDPLSRFYVVLMVGSVAGVLILLIRLTTWNRPMRINLRALRFAGIEHNLRNLFWLNVILVSACSSDQLLWGIRSELFLICNPNIDAIPPFDGLLTVVDLGFAVLALIYCAKWWVSIQIAKAQESSS